MLRTGISFLIVGTHCRFGPMTPLIPRARQDVWVSRMTEQILAMWVSSESEGVIYFNKLSSLHYQCPLRELELWTDIQKSSFPSLLRTCWTPYHVIPKNVTSASHLHELAYITLDTYTWYYVCNTFILSSRSTIIHSVSWYAQSAIFWLSFIYFLWFNFLSLYFNDEETCDYVHMMCHMIIISLGTWLWLHDIERSRK